MRPTQLQESFRDRRCLVTGGTGFIGGRLSEVLAGALGAKVRLLVRNLSQASRIARFPVELVRGDVAEPDDVEHACEGVDYVFHCAYGNRGNLVAQRRVTVGGTENVCLAARKHGARRVVHVSTGAVYGSAGRAELDESAPRAHSGDGYADTKLDAELFVLDEARKGLPATVVQPTVVYGPWGPAWTVRILNELSTGRVILVDGGQGLCNTVYVDDVVQALLLAALENAAVGEHFLVSGPTPVTWKEFYSAFEGVLGFPSTVSMSAEETLELFERRHGKKGLLHEGLAILRESASNRSRLKRSREIQFLLRVGKSLVPAGARRAVKERLRGGPRAAPTPARGPHAPSASHAERPIHLVGPGGVKLGQARTRVRIDKARRLLGYEPAFDFAAGMERVGAWARWANLTRNGAAEG